MPDVSELWQNRDFGPALAAWLNSNSPSEAVARTEFSAAIRKLNDLEGEYDWVRRAYDNWKRTPNSKTEDILEEAKEHVRPPELRRLFRSIRAFPKLARDASPFDKWEVQWRYQGQGVCTFREAAELLVFGMNADKAVQCLIGLAERGLLSRMRECCHCRTWVYAKKSSQRFCSVQCREKSFRTSPEGRRKRRDYMRRFRAGQKRYDQEIQKVNKRLKG